MPPVLRAHSSPALTPGTTYTFKTHQVSGQNFVCHDGNVLDDDVTFTTALASVSNIGAQQLGSTLPVGRTSNHRIANAFTTGNSASSYTAKRITILFGDSNGNMPDPQQGPCAYSSSARRTTATRAWRGAPLSGPARPSVNSTAAYTCAGTGCTLSPNTTYYVVLSVPTVVGETGRAY